MKKVICTVISGISLENLKEQVGNFIDADISFFDEHPDARVFTHYQTEIGGPEYIALLDCDGKVLRNDVISLCICGPISATL